MASDRPDIPPDVKLELRREAGFGCCVCGHPIIEYHHIVPWSVRHHFDPPDMMVLCAEHHKMCTHHAMLEDEQRKYKANPFNMLNGYVDGQLKVNQQDCIIAGGSCLFAGEGVIFRVNGEALLELRITEQRLSLSLIMYSVSNKLIASISDNEWIVGSDTWDVEAKYQKLTIRTDKGNIMLSMDTASFPLFINAKLRKDGETIFIKPKMIKAVGPVKFVLQGTAFYEMAFDISNDQGIAMNGRTIGQTTLQGVLDWIENYKKRSTTRIE